MNAAGVLNVHGNVTINGVRMEENSQASIVRPDDKTMKVNGISWTEKVNGKNVKYYDSVIKANDDLAVTIYMVPMNTESLVPGSKIMTCKYLDTADWKLVLETELLPYSTYQSGDDLFVGTELPMN